MTVATELQRIIDAKAAIKASIEAKGVDVANELIDGYAALIDDIPAGVDISDADAAVTDVVAPKTFYATSGGKKTGTMTDNGTVSTDISAVATEVTIAAGKHSGTGVVKIAAAEQAKIIAANIKKDVVVLGVTGTLESGGGTGDYLVRFIDDGTILKEQWVNSGEDATAPDDPTHDLLTFYGWNNSFENVTANVDVGAIFNTTDGHTYLWITLSSYTGINPVIYLNKSTTAVLNIYDNGTNTLIGTSSSSGNINIDLTGQFATVGDYVLRIECNGGYTFGNGSSSTQIFKNGNYRYILTKTYIGSSVTSLSAYSFYQCYSLTLITMPSGITSIGTSVFGSCYSIFSITIPAGVTSIGTNEFVSCYSIAYIIIPVEVTSIGNSAFSLCQSLASIAIPAGVTSIGNSAFSQCYSLASIAIPAGVTSIGNSAFLQCYSLTSITIPSGVTLIDSYLFYYCQSLASITIPAGVASIGISAFASCSKLILYIIDSTTPPTLANINAFTSMNFIAKIKVPAASVAAYQAATNWSDASIVNHIIAQ